MAKAIMIQGTASNVGKSLVAAGLCRLFRQDGYSVAPFKSQNMALNSFITVDNLEMGRAQAVQAEAAGIEPSVLMNPILLKPTGDAVSQVIVNGEVLATMGATEYYRRKTEFIPAVKKAYRALSARHDIIVIEGAGSPAEINLRDNDIVNMGMAAIAGAPVLLVGDIDRGGVFASLYGTVHLLEPGERARIKGIVINKFRGDVEILRPGLAQLEQLTGIPVLGVVPWLRVDIDDEDSLSGRFAATAKEKALDIAVIRLPHIANFTDFAALERHPRVGVRYAGSLRDLGSPDLVIIPGTKTTMADLRWLRENGLETAIRRAASGNIPVIGICGGFQMLGQTISDPDAVEGGGSMRGMELLPMTTIFARRKTRTRVRGRVNRLDGFFSRLSGAVFEGYEIHMGRSDCGTGGGGFARIAADAAESMDGMVLGPVMGSYVHGLFDSGEIVPRLVGLLLEAKGVSAAADAEALPDHRHYKEDQYNILADGLRAALDMNAVYSAMGMIQHQTPVQSSAAQTK